MNNVRRKAFRAALAIEEKSITTWAEEHGLSYTHVQLVLSNKRPSMRMQATIDSYIAATLVPFCRVLLATMDASSEKPNAA